MTNTTPTGFTFDGNYAEALEFAVGAGIVVRNRDGRVLHVSKKFCEMVGWQCDELVGTGLPAPYWADDSQASAERAFHRSIAGDAPNEGWIITLRQRSGERFTALAYVTPLRHAGAIVGIVTGIYDLTEQAAQVERRRKTEERLRLVLDVAQMGVWRWDLDTNTHSWSDECYKHLGLPRDQPIERDTFARNVHPDDRDRVMNAVMSAFETRQDYDETYRVLRPDGSTAWIRGMGRVFYKPDGRPERVEGVTQDVTLSRQREAARR